MKNIAASESYKSENIEFTYIDFHAMFLHDISENLLLMGTNRRPVHFQYSIPVHCIEA